MARAAGQRWIRAGTATASGGPANLAFTAKQEEENGEEGEIGVEEGLSCWKNGRNEEEKERK